MLKVLIVDDETLVRVGMKSIIPWEDNGFTIVDEAANGVQALEMARKYRPDIILTDIMMPQMDGIELIKRIKQEQLGRKFIILSCVSEISYLQQAIGLGVSRYILKSSVKPEELLDMVNEIAKDIKNEKIFDDTPGTDYSRSGHNAYLNEYFNLLIKANIEDKESINDRLSRYGIKTDQRIWLLVMKVSDKTSQETARMNYPVADICRGIVDDMYGGYVYVNYEDSICMLVYCGSEGRDQSVIEEICYRIRETVRQYFDCGIVAGMSEVTDGFKNVADEYRKAKYMLEETFFTGRKLNAYNHNAVSAEQLKLEKGQVMDINPGDSLEKILGAVDTIKNLVDKGAIISEQEVKKIYTATVRYVVLTLGVEENQIFGENDGIKSLNETIRSIDTFEELHLMAIKIIRKCYEISVNYNFGYYSDELTDAIIRYIKDNYRKKIKLSDLSDSVHFSADYICKYFKRKTGQNLSEYILRYKIYKSRELLLENKNISKTSYDLGFSSEGHFLRTFKKYEGITPGSYIKAHS